MLPDPVIERNVTVRPDGMITLDLIGDVQAGGRTTDQISVSIRQKMGRYKRDAADTVSVSSALNAVLLRLPRMCARKIVSRLLSQIAKMNSDDLNQTVQERAGRDSRPCDIVPLVQGQLE